MVPNATCADLERHWIPVWWDVSSSLISYSPSLQPSCGWGRNKLISVCLTLGTNIKMDTAPFAKLFQLASSPRWGIRRDTLSVQKGIRRGCSWRWQTQGFWFSTNPRKPHFLPFFKRQVKQQLLGLALHSSAGLHLGAPLPLREKLMQPWSPTALWPLAPSLHSNLTVFRRCCHRLYVLWAGWWELTAAPSAPWSCRDLLLFPCWSTRQRMPISGSHHLLLPGVPVIQSLSKSWLCLWEDKNESNETSWGSLNHQVWWNSFSTESLLTGSGFHHRTSGLLP